MALPKIERLEGYGEFNIRDEDGVHHDGIAGWCGSFLGLCGCGCPEETLDTALGVLSAIEVRSAAWEANDDSAAEQAYEQLNRLAPFEGEHAGLGYAFMYMLDAHGLLEHGSSIGGSWLTDDGKEFLARLREWKGSDPNTGTRGETE